MFSLVSRTSSQHRTRDLAPKPRYFAGHISGAWVVYPWGGVDFGPYLVDG